MTVRRRLYVGTQSVLAKAGELLLACYGRPRELVLGLHLSLCTL